MKKIIIKKVFVVVVVIIILQISDHNKLPHQSEGYFNYKLTSPNKSNLADEYLSTNISSRKVVPWIWLSETSLLCFSYHLTESLFTYEIVEDVT